MLGTEEPIGDLLYGVAAIAKHLGLAERSARHLCETGRLPTWKEGKMICARRSTLNAWLAECEAKARPAPADDAAPAPDAAK